LVFSNIRMQVSEFSAINAGCIPASRGCRSRWSKRPTAAFLKAHHLLPLGAKNKGNRPIAKDTTAAFLGGFTNLYTCFTSFYY
jgi:hypothetical protein